MPAIIAAVSISGLLTFVVYLAVAIILLALAFWLVGQFGLPEPIAKAVTIAIVVIAVIIIVLLLLQLVGGSPALVQ